jgi:hypothetical protein
MVKRREPTVNQEAVALPFEVERPEDTEYINAIIYGATGSGKTHLLGTAMDYPGTSPILLLDVEGGTKTLRGKKVDVVRPLSWKQIQDIYNFLRHDNHHYKAIGIDSLTELQKKYSLGAILGDLKEGESDYDDLGGTVVPTRQDWLKTGDQMRKFIRAFKELAYIKTGGDRIHVFMTCLEKTDEKRNIVGPLFSGQLSSECGAYVDVLARLSRIAVEEPGEGDTVKVMSKRHLLVDSYTNADGIVFLAKNRGSKVRQIWNPTIQKIVEMRGEDENHKTPVESA